MIKAILRFLENSALYLISLVKKINGKNIIYGEINKITNIKINVNSFFSKRVDHPIILEI